jgi:hypothetical protein
VKESRNPINIEAYQKDANFTVQYSSMVSAFISRDVVCTGKFDDLATTIFYNNRNFTEKHRTLFEACARQLQGLIKDTASISCVVLSLDGG